MNAYKERDKHTTRLTKTEVYIGGGDNETQVKTMRAKTGYPSGGKRTKGGSKTDNTKTKTGSGYKIK